jgi:hypothetical protein
MLCPRSLHVVMLSSETHVSFCWMRRCSCNVRSRTSPLCCLQPVSWRFKSPNSLKRSGPPSASRFTPHSRVRVTAPPYSRGRMRLQLLAHVAWPAARAHNPTSWPIVHVHRIHDVRCKPTQVTLGCMYPWNAVCRARWRCGYDGAIDSAGEASTRHCRHSRPCGRSSHQHQGAYRPLPRKPLDKRT